MTKQERILEIKKLINEVKKESFIEPEKASDQNAMGLLLSNYFDYDAVSILETVYSALEDINFHRENKIIKRMIDKLKGDWTENFFESKFKN